MKREKAVEELKRMYDVESRILLTLLTGEGTPSELNYVCQKLFEVAEYIIALEGFLERTKNDKS